MKRFIITILCVSVFFIGLGGLVEQVGAKFKSDARALALIKQARVAIGREANINGVKSLSAKGKAVQSFNFNGIEKSQTGDFEVNLALPNQFSKMMRFKREEAATEGAKNVVEENNKIFIFKKSDGEFPANIGEKKSEIPIPVEFSEGGLPANGGENGGVETGDTGKNIKREIRLLTGDGAGRGNDILRTMLGLFASAPEGFDVEYSYVGSAEVDGNSCEVVEAKTANDSVAKIYLSKSSNLPVMLSFQGMQMPKIMRMRGADAKSDDAEQRDVKVFVHKGDASETSEINVKFSDYRSVNGLQLPFVWTQTANGAPSEVITIENYEINPPNIAEKFNQIPNRIRIRTENKQ